jgi:hypothetical protein
LAAPEIAVRSNRHADERQRLSIGAWSALVLVLGSLWVGGLATASAGDASDYLAAKRAQQRMQSAALPDPFVALRPAPERSGWFGRLVRLLLAVLACAPGGGILAACCRTATRPDSCLVAGLLHPTPSSGATLLSAGLDRCTEPAGDRCGLMLEVVSVSRPALVVPALQEGGGDDRTTYGKHPSGSSGETLQ